MTLLKQFLIWMKSLAFGSVLTLILTSFVFQNINPIQHFISVLFFIFGYAVVVTLPIQIILYFLVNTDFRKGEKPSRHTMSTIIIYWVLLFVLLFVLLEGGNFYEIFVVLFISFVPISLLYYYKALTE